MKIKYNEKYIVQQFYILTSIQSVQNKKIEVYTIRRKIKIYNI